MGIFRKIYLSEVEVDTQLQDTKSVVQSETKSDWKFLLQPGIFKAVLIGAAIAILGQFMGVNAVLYYGPTIFEEAGLSGGDALFSQVLVGIVNVVTTVIAVFIIDKVGRKKLVYYGVSGMVLSLLLIGFYFHFSESMGLPNSFLLFFFLFYVFCCAISISAVIFVLLSEMYPTRIRRHGHVHRRLCPVDRHLPCGPAHPLACSRTLPPPEHPAVRPHVRALYAHSLEADSRNHRQVAGGDRTLLDEEKIKST